MKSLLGIILAILTVMTLVAGCSKPEPTPILTEPIETKYGAVCGEVITDDGNEIHIYKGIPYASPPIGDLRWQPPQPPASWTGVRECTEYSMAAPQATPFGGDLEFGYSEDCLYLNVLTPDEKPADKLPVMVWLHGGGYNWGSGNFASTNTPGLSEHGVVLVTVNTRLAVLGLLAHPLLSEESTQGVSGNYMFLDMIAALEWVRDNIAAFGGDPDNVTIFGQSGGGAKVANLMASPLAEGLFHKAILQSGITTDGFFDGVALEYSEKIGQKIFTILGVDSEADPLAAARALPWEDLPKDKTNIVDATIDGWFLTDKTWNTFKAGKQNPVPFMTVAVLGEITGPGMIGTLFPQWIPSYTNILANAGKAGVESYAAIFEYVPANWKEEGAVNTHGMEVAYVFGDMDLQGSIWTVAKALASAAGAKQKDPGLGDLDFQMSEIMMQIWTQFARTGNPSVPGLVEWPVYNADADEYLALDINLQVKSGFSLLAASGRREAKYVNTYTWEEAVEHIGETVIITGPVIDYLDFTFPDLRTDPVLGVGNPFGPNAFLVRLMVDVDSLPEDLYVGITISIIGEIGPNSFGGARIWVDDLSQIEIIE